MQYHQQVNINSSEFQPKNEYLLIDTAVLESEKTSDAGIIIPLGNNQGPQGRSTSGTVLAVGNDITDISVGDFVVWPNTDGLDLEFTDGEFMLLRYKSIIGKKK